MASPMTMRHIRNEISGSDLPCGGRFSSSGVGDSVASASAAMVSMIRFTQRSCTAVRTDWPSVSEMALMKASVTAVCAFKAQFQRPGFQRAGG